MEGCSQEAEAVWWHQRVHLPLWECKVEGRGQFRRILQALLRPTSYSVRNVESQKALHTGHSKLWSFAFQQKIGLI